MTSLGWQWIYRVTCPFRKFYPGRIRLGSENHRMIWANVRNSPLAQNDR